MEECASLWEREREGPLAPLFICFSILLGLPYTNWASQVCCLFYLKFSLRSSDLPLTFLCSIFAGVSLPCLLATTILDSCFLFYLTKWWDRMPWSQFSECWVLSQLFPLSCFTFIKRLFSSSLLFAIRVVSSVYLTLLIFLLAILIPVCASSRLVYLMMYYAYKLNKEGDNIQPWHAPFPIWNRSVVPCPTLTVVS